MANARSQSVNCQYSSWTMIPSDSRTVSPLERVVLSVLEGVMGFA